MEVHLHRQRHFILGYQGQRSPGPGLSGERPLPLHPLSGLATSHLQSWSHLLQPVRLSVPPTFSGRCQIPWPVPKCIYSKPLSLNWGRGGTPPTLSPQEGKDSLYAHNVSSVFWTPHLSPTSFISSKTPCAEASFESPAGWAGSHLWNVSVLATGETEAESSLNAALQSITLIGVAVGWLWKRK